MAWWCLGLLLVLVATAQAELQFDVFVGYGLGASDGVVAEGNWMPVTCEIFNDGPSFNGVVELTSSQANQRYSVPVELPTGTRKRILVPVYVSGRWFTMEARLRDSRGKLRAQHNQLQARLIADRSSPLIGSLSRTLSGAVVLPEKPARPADNQLTPAVARLSSELFPDHPMALEGLSVLYLHPARAVELKAGQVTALLAWLHGGGHLIVAAEQPGEVNAVPWLRQLLPCEITGVAPTAQHGVLQAWLHADSRRPLPGQVDRSSGNSRRPPVRHNGPNGPQVVIPNAPEVPASEAPEEPNPFVRLPEEASFESAPMLVAGATLRDGKVLVGADSAPLAIQCERGRGTLTVLLFSPELEPFKSWANRGWFWAKLCGVPIEWLGGWKFARVSGASLDAVFGAMIDSQQIRKLPIGWLFALLLAYLAVIGPVDQYVLKRLNRQMLTWVTFPAYVVFFSVLIYYIGYRLRAGETEWNEFHVIDVVPHGQRADWRGHSYGSVYSPANAQYPVTCDAPYATLRGERDVYGQEMSRVEIEQQGNTFKGRLNAPIWTSQLFLTDWWRQDKLPINVTIAPSLNNQYEVTVENLTGRQIPQARLVLDGKVHELGELVASKTFTVGRSIGEDLGVFVSRQASRFQNAASQRRSQFGNDGSHLSDFYNASSAASFASLIKHGNESDQFQPYQQTSVVPSRDFDLAASTARGDAVLLAWLPGETLVAPLNRFTPRRSHRDTLLRVIVQCPTSNVQSR